MYFSFFQLAGGSLTMDLTTWINPLQLLVRYTFESTSTSLNVLKSCVSPHMRPKVREQIIFHILSSTNNP